VAARFDARRLCIRRRGSHPIGRPLNGETPTIDLVVGYHKLKHPQFLRTFLSKMARTNEQILRPLATSRTKGYQGQSPWLVGRGSETTETRGIAILASVDPREYREIPSAL
jgi:hypothetical protein